MRSSDWSSDVCSSDLVAQLRHLLLEGGYARIARILVLAGVHGARLVDPDLRAGLLDDRLLAGGIGVHGLVRRAALSPGCATPPCPGAMLGAAGRMSSEERRVGTVGVSPGRSRWSQTIQKRNNK